MGIVSRSRSSFILKFPLFSLLLVYVVARVLQAFPQRVPILAVVALHVLPPLLFALLHGAIRYGFRGVLVFTFLCFVIGSSAENLSILTGFPFGRYHFTDAMGPKTFNVPVLLGLAYVGMGYLSWTLGLMILGDFGRHSTGLLTRPLVAAFLMIAWDLSMDPIWSNLVHLWVWHEGGAYFGVPVSNFFGWYLTVYLIYQSFAVYLRRRVHREVHLPSSYWQSAVLFYGISAAGNLLVLPPSELATITDASGTSWKVSGILGVSAIVSVFVMGAFALIAWTRFADKTGKLLHFDR